MVAGQASMTKPRRRWVQAGGVGLALGALLLLFVTAIALAVTGELTQLPGKTGCVSEDGTSGSCRDGKALGLPDGVTVSPDGKSVYAASFYSNAVAVFARQTP